MFKRMTTSLSKPPLAVFFMKDSWGRALLYLFFLPLLLIIPILGKSAINPGMSIERYDTLIQSIQKNFTVQNTTIIDGVLSYEGSAKAKFDHFSLYIGNQEMERSTIALIFEETELVLYMNKIEFERVNYEEINLMNHDFSDNSLANSRKLASSIKIFYDEQDIFLTTDVMLTYLFGLYDYTFYVLLMAIMMMLFVPNVQIPFRYRLKLSIYLSTIYIFIVFVLLLFGQKQLEFLSVFALYFYHIWAYRSMKTIQKGAIL
ncbi:MAG: DUF1189 family protein [Acholeplasmataceae bacterium]|nr:DUF1189 family protein [Acholeplasmataceae bacterium]